MNSFSTTISTSFLPIKTPSTTNPPPPPPPPPPPSLLHFSLHHHHSILLKPLHASSSSSSSSSSSTPQHDTSTNTHPFLQNLKSFTKTSLLLATTASLASTLTLLPANAHQTPTLTSIVRELEDENKEKEDELKPEKTRPLSDFLDSNTEAVDSLKSLLQTKVDNGEDEEAFNLLQRLVDAQPSVTEWKLLMARLLGEMGQTGNARKVFDEILEANPLSFEALYENALLMDKCGEGEAVIKRLEEALEIARDENKVKEERDVRLIIAQIQFLQRNVDDALRSYDELSKEDPQDFRPYFCRGMIYSLLDKNEEARAEFAKYKELSPKKFDVGGYLRTPLSRVKIFGTNDEK